ncbi:MAG: DHH family phosphoesterase [Colwellia sp.]|nr:DHH family phosphoesterase [Colwellia sp.]
MITKTELENFVERIVVLDRIIIQAHDFPDHDAISSAYALAHLFQAKGATTLIVYNGNIDRISLSNMIDWLEIPVFHINQVTLSPADKIVTVDGCIGEKNVLDLPGDEIAVIDHHQVTAPPNLWFSDIRPEYGATATILYEYYCLLGLKMPRNVATALMVGLNIDTANLTRGFVNADIRSFAYFNNNARLDIVNKVCRNEIELKELALFTHAMSRVQIELGVATVFMTVACPKNMLGILSDFLLKVNEIDVVIVATQANDNIQISLRSECPKTNVGLVAREILNDSGRGFGGGHSHMAGGIILKDHKHHFGLIDQYHFKPFVERFIELRTV